MIIENHSSYGNTRSHEVLAHAQTISNFFIDALEQNDCTLKVVVGFYFEIDDTINTLEDLIDALVEPDIADKVKPERGRRPSYPNRSRDTTKDVLKSSPGVEATVQALKQRCFNCKLSLPKIHFDKDFRFSYNKLSFQLETYEKIFGINRPRLVAYCQTAFALQKTCVPDILRIIALLLTALTAILALNRLPKISLGAFVKAIIGKLMASVVANIKISIDMSQTGVPCVLSAIEEIARAVPTKQEIYDLDMDPKIREKLFPTGKFVPKSVFEQSQRQKLKNKEITQEQYQREMEEYRKRNEPLRFYSDKLRSETEGRMSEAEDKISEAFDKVSSVVTKAQDDVNSYISSILGLIDYFECEGARSGPDFTDLISYINDLQTVINLFSAILGKWLAKIIDPMLCKEHISIQEINKMIQDNSLPPLTNKDIAEILEEFSGLEHKLSNDDLTVLIYDKPYKRRLPKLELIGCNIKDFAEAHHIDNVINSIIDTSPSVPGQPPVPYTPAPLLPIPGLSRIPQGSGSASLPRPFYYKPKDISLPPARGRLPVEPLGFKILERLRRELGDRPGSNRLFPKGYLPIVPITSSIPVNPGYLRDPLRAPESLPKRLQEAVVRLSKIPTGSSLRAPVESVDISSGTSILNTPDFLKELDSLIDFLYNPPHFDQDRVGKGLTQPPLDIAEALPSLLEPLLEEEQGYVRKDSKRRSSNPTQQECKSFEDVLDVLSNLRI